MPRTRGAQDRRGEGEGGPCSAHSGQSRLRSPGRRPSTPGCQVRGRGSRSADSHPLGPPRTVWTVCVSRAGAGSGDTPFQSRLPREEPFPREGEKGGCRLSRRSSTCDLTHAEPGAAGESPRPGPEAAAGAEPPQSPCSQRLRWLRLPLAGRTHRPQKAPRGWRRCGQRKKREPRAPRGRGRAGRSGTRVATAPGRGRSARVCQLPPGPRPPGSLQPRPRLPAPQAPGTPRMARRRDGNPQSLPSRSLQGGGRPGPQKLPPWCLAPPQGATSRTRET